MWNANSEEICFSGFNLHTVPLCCLVLGCQRMGTISAGMSCYHQPWAQWLLPSHWLMTCHQSLWLVRMGRHMRWHLWCWHEVCELCITQIDKLRKQDTPHSRPWDQRPEMTIIHSSSILVMRYIFIFIIWIWNIPRYARGVIVDWSWAEITDSHCLPDLVSCLFSLKSQLETQCW